MPILRSYAGSKMTTKGPEMPENSHPVPTQAPDPTWELALLPSLHILHGNLIPNGTLMGQKARRTGRATGRGLGCSDRATHCPLSTQRIFQCLLWLQVF